jgi:hypothetical protein
MEAGGVVGWLCLSYHPRASSLSTRELENPQHVPIELLRNTPGITAVSELTNILKQPVLDSGDRPWEGQCLANLHPWLTCGSA